MGGYGIALVSGTRENKGPPFSPLAVQGWAVPDAGLRFALKDAVGEVCQGVGGGTLFRTSHTSSPPPSDAEEPAI